MKNSNKCIKCGSDNVVTVSGHNLECGSTSHNNIDLGMNSIYVTRHICCDCGYAEEWIDSKQDLSMLKKKYAG